MAGFSPITYAILKKKITSALTGIKNIFKDPDKENTIIFETNDGGIFPISFSGDLKQVYIGDEEPTDPKIVLWVDTSEDDSGAGAAGEGGNSILFTDKDPITETIGGLAKGTNVNNMTVSQIFEKMLWRDMGPSVTLTTNSPALIYVTDNNGNRNEITNLTLTLKTTKGSYDMKSYLVQKNNVEISNAIPDFAAGSKTYTYRDPETITSTVTYKFKVIDEKGVSSNVDSKTIKFIEKRYYGTIPDGEEITPENILAKCSIVNMNDSKSFNFENIKMDYGRTVYAYPKYDAQNFPNGYQPLTSIVDKMNNDLLSNSYERKEMILNNITYYVYYLKDPVGLEGDAAHYFK